MSNKIWARIYSDSNKDWLELHFRPGITKDILEQIKKIQGFLILQDPPPNQYKIVLVRQHLYIWDDFLEPISKLLEQHGYKEY